MNKKRKIMLVDDDQTILQTGRSMLKEHYDVLPLPSVDKLFEVLKKVTPDLILMDIKMPGIGGFEAMTLLKDDARYSKVPVIFLTASNDRESVLKGIAIGAADFIVKPFFAGDLLSRIEKQLAPEEKGKQAVLIIDDSPEILMTVYTMLRDTYKIFTLPDPKKMQSILHSVKPDLFLLDYKMPELSGFDLIPIIRGFPEHKDTPIILLTSEGSFDHLVTSVDLGVCDFIVKPFSSEVLHEKIIKHLS